MRILVTNDDGYTSEGLQVLADALGYQATPLPFSEAFSSVTR